jgi:tape measure domain-containing protein
MRNAQRQVSQSSKAMQKSVSDLQLTLKETATFSSRIFRTGALVFGGAFGVQALLGITDAAKSLTAQLKLATAEYGSFAKAQKDVRDIAEATRSDLLATSELYSALQRNSGQLGTTQEQTARATQTVAEAFKISGAATSEQSAATRQLIQAFQSGVLRGDEFNSVMENAPRLARLLADSLGVTVGKLRAMAEAGELTADKLVRAFTDKKFTAGLDEEFKQLPVTFDQAMGQLYNAAIIVFSAFDRGGQFSNSIANFVTDGTDGFKELEQSAFNFGKNVSDTFAAIDEVRQLLGSLQTDGIGAFAGLTNATYSWRDALADALGVLDGVVNAFANLANAPGNLIRLGLGKSLILDPSNMRGGFLDATSDKRSGADRFGGLFRGGTGRAPPPFVPPAPKAKAGGRTKKAPRDRSEDVEFQFSQEVRRAQLDVLNAQQQLVQSIDKRAEISLQILDLEKQIHDAEVDDRVRRAERDFAEKKITAGALEQVKVQAGQLKAEYDKKDALDRQAVQIELATQRAEEIEKLREVNYDIERAKLEAESNLAETASERRDVELRLLDLAYRQEKARLEAIIAEEEAKDIAQQNLVRLQEARLRLAGLDAQNALDKQGVIAGTRGPMEDYLASLPTTAAKAQEALERLQVQGFEGLIDAAIALSDGLDSAADSLLKTLRDFFLGMARLELQKGLGSLLQGAQGQGGILGSLLGGIFGGGGSIGDASAPMSVSFGSATPLATVPDLSTMGFASGGSFTVLGRHGIDRNVMSIGGLPVARVSYGERVNISNDNEHNWRRMGRGDVTMYVNTPDADSFRRSEGQITRGLRRKLA